MDDQDIMDGVGEADQTGHNFSEEKIDGEESAASSTDIIQNNTDQNPSTTGIALTSFPIFPKLQPELRDMVWGFAAHLNRTIVLDYDGFVGNFRAFSVKTSAPAITQACHRSRVVSLRIYKPLTHVFEPGLRGNKPKKKFYINLKTDTLYGTLLGNLCTLFILSQPVYRIDQNLSIRCRSREFSLPAVPFMELLAAAKANYLPAHSQQLASCQQLADLKSTPR